MLGLNIKKNITICGNYALIDSYYPNSLFSGLGKKGVMHKKKGMRDDFEKSTINLSRAHDNLFEIVTENKNALIKFHTYTYTKPQGDLKTAYKDFHLFIKRLEYKTGKKITYVCVAEIQHKRFKRLGELSWHFHMLSNCDYVKKNKLEDIWGLGFVKPQRVKKIKDSARYIAKYLTKEMLIRKAYNMRTFLTSHNLKKPIKKTSIKEEVKDLIFAIDLFTEKILPTSEINISFNKMSKKLHFHRERFLINRESLNKFLSS